MSKPQSSSNTTNTPPQGGRGGNRNRARGGSGRGRGSNSRKPNYKKVPRPQRSKQFVGDTPKLSDVVFDNTDKTLKKWSTITQKLYRSLNKTYSISVSKSVECLKDLSTQYHPVPSVPANTDSVSMTILRQMADAPTKAQYKFRENMASAFSTIHGQCTPALILDMKGEPDYQTVYAYSDTIGLMSIIHRLVHRQERHQYDIMSKINIMRQYFQCYMRNNEDPADFYERFAAIRTAMNESGIKMVWPSTREASRQQLYPQIKMADLDQWQHHQVTDHADEAFHTVMIIVNSGIKKYKGLITQLNNDWVTGQDHYPRTEATAIRMQRIYISSYVPDEQQQRNEQSDDQDDQLNSNEQSTEPSERMPEMGAMFAQQGDDTNQFYCGACKKKHDYNYLDCVIL